MILLRFGGIYADIDTECRIPIDTLILPTDTMVVGWENEWATNAVAFEHHYVRRRQVGAMQSCWVGCQWLQTWIVFCKAPLAQAI